jgi:uncharacterized protein YlxW (UPF0749 family)
VLVPVVFAIAGLLLATSVATSHGGQLPGQRDDLPGLVADRQGAVARLDRQATTLRRLVDAEAAGAATGNGQLQQARRQQAAAGVQAGLAATSGAGLTVALDDAPRSSRDRTLPPGVPPPTPDDLVVHQQDVQAALNGLRAGGARALSVMGQRVIATTAVKCVGNTLLVNGRVYSPPFVLVAIGDPTRLQAGLDGEPGVQIYRQYVAAYGLGLTVSSSESLHLPAYSGAVALVQARPLAG